MPGVAKRSSRLLLQDLVETGSLNFHSPTFVFLAMILIVEDDAVVRNSLALLLRGQGHEVMVARDGTEALALLNNQRCGLVITDLVMPKLNGFQLVDQIRSKWRQTPILLISGFVSQDAGKSILGDVAEFMRTPIDPPALIATVQRLLTPISPS